MMSRYRTIDMPGKRLVCRDEKFMSAHEIVEELKDLEQRLAEAEKKISEWEAAPEWVKAGDGTLHGAIDYWQDRAHKEEQRLRWILKKCFVNRYAEVSLPCGMTLITDDEIQESIRLIDRAIELKEKGEL